MTWTLAVSSMGQAGKGFKDFSSPEDISRTSADKNGEIYPNFAESVHQQRPEECQNVISKNTIVHYV